jgi:Nitrile hydratase, alpha chain
MAQSAYPKILAKAWSDDSYQRRLVADPASVLREEGWDIPSSMTVEIRTDAPAHTLIIGLPKKPEGLNDERLREESNKYCVNPCSSC